MVRVFFSLLLHFSHQMPSVLIGNLRVHVKPMYHLYSILKDRDEPPTLDEIDIASAKRKLDPKAEAEYLQKLESSSENIKKAFQDQQACAIISKNPSSFQHLRLMIYNRGHGIRRSSSK